MLLGRIIRRIIVERKEIAPEPIRIVRREGNIQVLDVKKVGDRIVVTCSYEIRYYDEKGAEYARIYLEGEILSDEEILLKEWETSQKLSAENLARVLNFFLDDAQVYALLLAKWEGLPAPINLPRVAMRKKE